jgi:hypothetical protein
VIRSTIPRRRLLQCAVAGVVTWFGLHGSTALAHRSHVSLTRVTPNPRSGKWELVHAIHYHDALRLLAARGMRDEVQPASVEGRARLALEVERGFRWIAPDGSLLQPVTVGAELEGDNVLVYQELPAPTAAGRYTVETTFMHDVFDDQRNNVSLEFESPHTTLRLSRQTPRSVFEPPQVSRRAK